MREKLGILLGVLVFVAGVVGWSAPAMADSIDDPGVVQRPAQRDADPRRVTSSSGSASATRRRRTTCCRAGNSIHNAIRFDIPLPARTAGSRTSSRAWSTRATRNHPDGTTANLDSDVDDAPLRADQPRPRRTRSAPAASRASSASASSPPATSAARCTCPTPFGYQNSSSHVAADLPRRQQGRGPEEASASRSSTSTATTGGADREAAVARHRRLRRLRVHDAGRLLRRARRLDLDRQRAHDRHVRPPARRRHHQRGAVHATTVPR